MRTCSLILAFAHGPQFPTKKPGAQRPRPTGMRRGFFPRLSYLPGGQNTPYILWRMALPPTGMRNEKPRRVSGLVGNKKGRSPTPRPHAPATEAIQRGANLKRPQPHAVAPAHHASQRGMADAPGRNLTSPSPPTTIFTAWEIWSLAGGSGYD